MSLNLKRNVFALTVVLAIAVIAVWLSWALPWSLSDLIRTALIVLVMLFICMLALLVWMVFVVPTGDCVDDRSIDTE